MNELNEIYTDMILELYRNPVNKGELNSADVAFRDFNPLCGDEIEIQIKFDSNMIKEIKFQGQGCAISQAAASVLTDMVKGKKIDSLLKLEVDEILKELRMPNLKNNPVRMKCAALSLKVLKTALIRYLHVRN